MCHQVHDVFFKIGPGTTDDTHLVLPDHFRQAETKFCGAHGASQGHHHFTTCIHMLDISFGSIHQAGSIEVTIMMENEVCDGFMAHDSN